MSLACACVFLLLRAAAPAYGDFPYGSGPPFQLPAGSTPSDLADDGNDWKFAATPEANSQYANDPIELFGVRGAHVVDSDPDVETAWQTTTGRPDVTIAVLDSGIRWNDAGAMNDLRGKTRLNRGELPRPKHADGSDCAAYDCNGDGVLNVDDYGEDPRVSLADSRRVGPAGTLVPQDLVIAFSNGTDADRNGFVDDVAGWDFMDDDNDPFDDVQYGHGTGEARDSSAEANNGGQAGACPNCMFVPLRVGDSFIADVNRFAQAVIYAVDNGVLVVQEALGTVNNTRLARRAVEYAFRHGVPVIASAADEAAQHHNWPSTYPHTIVVNSINKYESFFTPSNRSYLQFNGCTNFSTKVTLSIPSSSCSSNATGLASGYAGLVVSAALNARDQGRLRPHPSCRYVSGDRCVLSAGEVRQLMASGEIDGGLQSDDVNFATQPEPSCRPPTRGCTNPNRLFADTNANRPVNSVIVDSKSYPARKGFDEFYGYGRANIAKAAAAASAGTLPPEAEITAPDWYEPIDPSGRSLEIDGQVFARSAPYTCRVEVAPGSEPNNARASAIPPGDFEAVSSRWCDGTRRTSAFDSAAHGPLATVDLARLKSRFPNASFDGREPPPGPPNFNNRPNTEPYGFVVRIVVTSAQAGKTLTGQDRRNLYLHRDRDLLRGFPKSLVGDGQPAPIFADLDGDNRNELVFATGDGIVHALRPDGRELRGWPVHTDPLPLHARGRAFRSGEVSQRASSGAILSAAAVGDLDRDGSPEVVAADLEGRLYAWDVEGELRFRRETNPDFSGRPLAPFVNVRQGIRHRTQHGIGTAPVLADLDGNGGALEIIVAGLDRHVYAWDARGRLVDGFPVLVVDRSKISAIDPRTHVPTFRTDIGGAIGQGAIIDTPAVGDLTRDGRPEIVVGTNEAYPASDDGGLNVGNLSSSFGLVLASGDPGNSRLFAIEPTGDPGGPTVSGPSPFLANWPVKVAMLQTDVFPVVGEGITGAPVIGPVACPSGGGGAKAGVSSALGPAYIFNPDGSSCHGRSGGRDNALQQEFPDTTARFDTPVIPAFGHPAFGRLGGEGISFLAPVSGLIRFADTALNEYQGGQDFIAAWDAGSGQFRPGFPSPVNDLQFLTGPSIADIGSGRGEEVLGGSGSLDLNALDAAGAPFSRRWPKLTSDWTIANPLIGTFGTLDTDGDARKVVAAETRSGLLFAYRSQAGACTPASWPRFHHDNANSGDYRRDATAPGRPFEVELRGRNLTFRAPGDDLLCRDASRYELRQSDEPITSESFDDAEPLAAPDPESPGTSQSLRLPPHRERFLAIRAVDEQGNAGPLASIDRRGCGRDGERSAPARRCRGDE